MLAAFVVNTTFDTVDSNPGDGIAADASDNTSLRAAIMEANAFGGTDNIQIPAGIYPLTISGSLENAAASGDLDITDSVIITGSGASQTTIDGGGLDRVFDVRFAGLQVTLSSLGIRGGIAPTTNDFGREHYGGGVRNQGASLQIEDVDIRGNRTGDGKFGGRGGGIYTESGSLTVRNSILAENRTGDGLEGTGGAGGAIAGLSSEVMIRDSQIINNRTGNGSAAAGRGGGIHSESSSATIKRLTIVGTTIAGNATGSEAPSGLDRIGTGGGISFSNWLVLEDSIIDDNTSFNGGGIMVGNGTVERIVNSTISNNTATGGEGGGGIHNEAGVISLISGTTISGNQAVNTQGSLSGGGGIFSQGDIGTIVNSTISGNSTNGVGGGLGNHDHVDLILNTTVANNSARDGGGIYHGLFANFTPVIDQLTNTIVGDNTDLHGFSNNFRIEGQLNSAQNNLIESVFPTSIITGGVDANIVGTDPLLGSLADNGGLTLTHALLTGSPAIDAANTASAPAIDQRGVSRPQGIAADIGAFEVEVAANRPPAADDFTATIDEDAFLDDQLSATDPDGDALIFELATTPANGSAGVRADGRFFYSPDWNYNGADSFTYTVSDGNGGSDTRTVEITIAPIDDAPFVDSPALTTEEDQPLTATIEHLEAEGDPVTFEVVTDPGHGTAVFDPTSPGTFTYTPAADFNGTDSFTFQASDDQGNSREGAVTIIVTPVNDAPVAKDDQYRVNEDETLVLDASPVFRLNMESEPGDWVGAGQNWNFSDADASFSGKRNFDSGVSVSVSGSTSWGLDFAAPFVMELTPGHYPEAMRYPFQGPDKPGLSVYGDGRGHNTSTGEFTVYEVDYGTADATGESIVSFAATFVQRGTHDDTVDPPLTGTILYNTAIGTGAGVLANDSDLDGDLFTVLLVEGPAHGTLAFNDDGTFSYTPDENFSGADSFTYRTNDGQLDSNVATVEITVDAIADAPVAAGDAYALDEDTTLQIPAAGVLANDTDADGDPLSAVLFEGPSNGALTLNPDGSFTYTPNDNFHGADSFTYKANDGALDSDVAVVEIAVGAVNDSPVAVGDSYSVVEDAVLAIAVPGVLANDTDADGDPLSAVLVEGPSNGALALNPDGSFTYTPNDNFQGVDSFTYKASDGELDSDVAVVEITIGEINDSPVAAGDAYALDEDSTLQIPAVGVLANDTDADGDPLSAVLVEGPSNGALTLNPDGSFTYMPNDDFHGADSFTYKVNDGALDSDVAVVEITVGALNDAPVAGGDSYNTDEDLPLAVAAPGVLSDDSDVDGDLLSAVLVEGPSNGALALNPDGSFTYTPNDDFHGADSFTYKASDGELDSDVAVVEITVGDVNDSPVAGGDSYSVVEDAVLAIAVPGVLANDTDADGDPLSAVLVEGPSNGALTLNPDGSFTYTPNDDFHGADSFTYKVNDGALDSDVAVVEITVGALNDAPVAVGDSYSTDEDLPLTVAAPGVLSDDSDVDGDLLSAVLVEGPSNGALTLNPDGSFTYTPNDDFHGADSFTYKVNDGALDSDVAVVEITIGEINDSPVAAGDAYVLDEDSTLQIPAVGVLANDTDADGDPLSAVLVEGPSNGALTLNPDGSFTYTPNDDFHGADSFTYKVNDGALDSDVAVVEITVGALNDAPVAGGDSYNTDEDLPLAVAAPGVLSDDSDVDGDLLSAVLVEGPSNGALALNPDGSFTYTPNDNFQGVDSFTYKASDGELDSDVAVVEITIGEINDSPVAAGDAYALDEDSTLQIPAVGVLANDTDADGDPLSAVLVEGPSNGALTLNPDGSFTYTPNDNFQGVDSFTYKASDGELDSDVAVVEITIGEINDSPVAAGDAYALDEDSTLQIPAVGVLANDTDADGDPLSAVLVEGPSNGALTLNPDGSFTYTPNDDFHGADSFTYKVNDGALDSDVAVVEITVGALNDSPVAVGDSYSTDEDLPLTVAAPGVLSDDSDVDGDLLSAVLVEGPSNGALALNPDGSFTYTPNDNFHGADSFTYKASDGELDSDVAVVEITVGALNDAPVAVGDSYSTDEDLPLTVAAPGVLSDDSDVDGDLLSAVLVEGPSNGALTLNPDGSFTYTPNDNFQGVDSFTYKASDGELESDVAVVEITVSAADVLELVIDIRPGSASNPINPRSGGRTKVGVLSTDTFDALSSIDVGSLTFGRTGAEDSLAYNKKSGEPDVEVRDINRDGRLDLVVGFNTRETGLLVGDTQGIIQARARDGRTLIGWDLVRVVGSGRHSQGEGERDATASTPNTMDTVWNNWAKPLDVNDDGLITPLDTLITLNALNRGGGGMLPRVADDAEIDIDFLDTNGDGQLSPIDALVVINQLNRRIQAQEIVYGGYHVQEYAPDTEEERIGEAVHLLALDVARAP